MVLITLSGGLQDAYTFITRGGVFANAQTGNIVLLSGSLFSASWGRALSYLVPIISFAMGILASAMIRKRCSMMAGGRVHWRQLIILMEIIILSAVAWIPEPLSHIANAMVSFSCAMQVEAFRTAGGYAYASTMCIGNLRSCMSSIASFIDSGDRKHLRAAGYYAFAILVFAIGAGAGTILSATLSLHAIWFSPLLLMLSFLLMLRRPQEEGKAVMVGKDKGDAHWSIGPESEEDTHS